MAHNKGLKDMSMNKKKAQSALQSVLDRKIHVIDDFNSDDLRAFEKEVKSMTRGNKKITLIVVEN